MYKALIIDDEEMARTLLKGMLEEYCSNVKVIDACKDLPSGVKSIYKNKPDIVFLDIEMPGHSGLELIDFFNDEEINFSVIFVTAYNKYAIQAFKLSAVDYLLKPVEADDLVNAVKLFEKRTSKNDFAVLKNNLTAGQARKIAIPSSNSIKYIDINDILLIKADGAYSLITLKDHSVLMVSKGLKSFEDTLTEFAFFIRCHKSYIININYITEHVKSNGGYVVIDKKFQANISPDKILQINNRLDLIKNQY
jgi:two-component system, LytTR family, response regulator